MRTISLCIFLTLKFYRIREADMGNGKSSIYEDIIQVHQAFVEGLEDELQWPDAEKRQE
jgi:hypothetical protein